MTHYYQFILLLLAAGHIYCIDYEEFSLKDGSTFEIWQTKIIVKDSVLNSTHIKHFVSYNVTGFTRTNDTRKNLNLTMDIDSVSEMPLKDGHHHVQNCTVFLNPLSSNDRNVTKDMFEVLQKHIQDQVCESLVGSDEVDINMYEDKDNSLKNMVISHSKFVQAQEAFDTVFDAALLLARKKFEVNDFIDPFSMDLDSLNSTKSYLSSREISNVTIGNLSTIARNRSVTLSKDNDVVTLNVHLNMNLELNYNESTSRYNIIAPQTVVKATINLDDSKGKCKIISDYVELDFNNSVQPNPDTEFGSNPAYFYLREKFAENSLPPKIIAPIMQEVLEELLNKYLDCEILKQKIVKLSL